MDLTIKDGPESPRFGLKLAQSEPLVAPHGNPGLYLADA